ncbi:hypothetical protein RFI_11371 [Reticulomyxa filosa]|uniref:Rap-GAP domain-containing protein n=1 Tax=Reticulomyxa filosa TaxID=46433 RepID=X6NHH1_RETFI|nr:hypothetical protein RFI_11371 [Reticulomyxa filosa]|eukprot:ETO25770.1 hypothetical protein RFI_11371 [Reticulomyxa filosa]
MVRTLTVETLRFHARSADDDEDKEKENEDSKKKNKGDDIWSLVQDKVYDSFFKESFSVDDRCKEINMINFEFSNFGQAHMIWDRILHLLGDPTENENEISRRLHLEGFTDALKIFIIILYTVPMSAARRVKESIKRANQEMMMSGSSTNLTGNMTPLNSAVTSVSTTMITSSSLDTSDIDLAKEYGFSFATIPVPINISDTEHFHSTILDVLPLPPRHLLPQGKTLAYTFAPYLFKLCFTILKKQSFQQELQRVEFATAFECLAHIMFTPSEVPCSDEVLSLFYQLILEVSGLQTANNKIQCIIVRECAKGCIFGKNLKGVQVLIPSVLQCWEKKKEGNNKSEPQSDIDVDHTIQVLSIASTLISCGTHFQACQMNQISSNTLDKCEFADLKLVILEAFENSYQLSEEKSEFANLIVSGLTVLIFDELSSTQNPKILERALRCLVNCTSPTKLSYGAHAARALDGLSTVCKQLTEVSSELVLDILFPDLLRHSLEYVTMATASTVSRSRTTCNNASDLIFCLLSWVFHFPPSVLRNSDLIGGVLKILSGPLEFLHTVPEGKKLQELTHAQQLMVCCFFFCTFVLQKRTHFICMRMCMFCFVCLFVHSKTAMMMLFHYLNNYPLKHDVGTVSSNARDVKPPQGIYLIHRNNCIINACDQFVSHERGPQRGVRMIVRDESGKCCWRFTPCSTLPPFAMQLSMHHSSNSGSQKKSPISVEQSKSDIESNENDLQFEKKEEDINTEIKSIRAFARQRTESQFTAHLKGYLKETPAFDYDLISQTDGLSQILRYIENKLQTQEVTTADSTTTTPGSNSTDENSTKQKANVPPSTQKDNAKTAISNPQPQKRYSRFGALPPATLSEQNRVKLSSQLSTYESEEKELNDKCQQLRDGESSTFNGTDETSTNKLSNELVDPSNATVINQYDCTRFLFSHLGLLTCGQILEEGDFPFSVIETRTKSGLLASPSNVNNASAKSTAKTNSRKEPQGRQNPKNAIPLSTWQSILEKINIEKYQLELKEETLGVVPKQEVETLHKRLDLIDRTQGATLRNGKTFLSLLKKNIIIITYCLLREFHKIGVEFVGRDQDTQHDILANDEGSYSYEKFVEDLGWMIDLTVHEGFVGGLTVGSTGRYATYYATATYEMLFHVATRMISKQKDSQYTERKRHVANDHVNIIWTEHTRPYLPQTISTDFNTVSIIIYPLSNGLFRVQVHKKVNVGNFGPLINNMIVRQHLLAPLVRLTALEANRTVQLTTIVFFSSSFQIHFFILNTIAICYHKSRARDLKLRLSFRERRTNLDDYCKKWQKKDGASVLAGFFPSLGQQ